MLGLAGPNPGCGYGAAPAETPRCPAAGGLGGGRMSLGTTKVDVNAVHTQLMTKQGNRSVAFGRQETCLVNILFFPGNPKSTGNGNLSAGISSLCFLPCYRVTDGVGQGLKRGRWLSRGVMLPLHRPPVSGMSPTTQPRSVVVSVGAISSSLFEGSGKTCVTLGFMASTSPPPGSRWGSKGHLPSGCLAALACRCRHPSNLL